MNPRNLIILFIMIILILSVLFLPALMGTGISDLPDEDDLASDDGLSIITNFSVAWIVMLAYQTLVPLWLRISIFALFLVYVGGRSKQKRFNDRTIDHVNVLIAELLKTALIRAVFNFPFFINYPNNTLPIFLPILIPNLRRYEYDAFDCWIKPGF